jgi:hypothetical protein
MGQDDTVLPGYSWAMKKTVYGIAPEFLAVVHRVHLYQAVATKSRRDGTNPSGKAILERFSHTLRLIGKWDAAASRSFSPDTITSVSH